MISARGPEGTRTAQPARDGAFLLLYDGRLAAGDLHVSIAG